MAAEDLCAETWLTAARRISEFSGTEEDFAGWLFGIARRLSANAHRRSRRRGTDPAADPLVPGSVAGPEADLVGREAVTRALAGLSRRERDVVACIDVVGLDVESTARALGLSSVAVRVAHHRGLKRLRRQQEERPVGQPAR